MTNRPTEQGQADLEKAKQKQARRDQVKQEQARIYSANLDKLIARDMSELILAAAFPHAYGGKPITDWFKDESGHPFEPMLQAFSMIYQQLLGTQMHAYSGVFGTVQIRRDDTGIASRPDPRSAAQREARLLRTTTPEYKKWRQTDAKRKLDRVMRQAVSLHMSKIHGIEEAKKHGLKFTRKEQQEENAISFFSRNAEALEKAANAFTIFVTPDVPEKQKGKGRKRPLERQTTLTQKDFDEMQRQKGKTKENKDTPPKKKRKKASRETETKEEKTTLRVGRQHGPRHHSFLVHPRGRGNSRPTNSRFTLRKTLTF